MPQSLTDKRLVLRRHLEVQKKLHTAPYMITTAATLDTGLLSLETIKSDFFQKSCAVYITTPLDMNRPAGQEQLLWAFNYFFKGLDIKAALAEAEEEEVAIVTRGAFPCKFLACWSPRSPHRVSEIQQAHLRICSHIDARQADSTATAGGGGGASDSESQLHPLFRAILIIMDRLDGCQAQEEQQQRRHPDIQLIRTGHDTHLRSGPIDLDPLRFAFWVSDDGNTLRGRFENVMSLIMEWRWREDDARREKEEEDMEDMEAENEF